MLAKSRLARRSEANEEIGLQPEIVETLGELDHLTTITRRSYIVPVVGLLTGVPRTIANPTEGREDPQRPDRRTPGTRGVPRGTLGRWRDVEAGLLLRVVRRHGMGGDSGAVTQMLALLTGTDPGGEYDLDPARGTEMVNFQLGPDGMGGVV